MALWQRARDELQKSKSPTKVISAEGLWVTNPNALRNELPSDVPVGIVVYLRRQDQYLQSLWKQAVTGGRKSAFGHWLEKSIYRGDYLSTVEQWASVFGADSLTIRPYERTDGSNTVADFCQLIGAVGLPPTEDIRRNFSPRRELAHFMRALNNADMQINHRNLFRAFIAKNNDYIRSCDMLSSEDASKLLECYAESNRLLIERYYHDSSTPLFPELVSSPGPEIWRLDNEEFFQLTIDVLDVVIEEVRAGRISDPPEGGGQRRRGERRGERRAHRAARRSKRLEESAE